jgi:hypothetical protein
MIPEDRMSAPTSTRHPHRGTAAAWIAAALACGVCCAGPLLGLWASVTALLAAAAIWIPPLAGLAVAAALAGYLVHRRRRPAAHRTGVINLGLPGTTRPANPESTSHPDTSPGGIPEP